MRWQVTPELATLLLVLSANWELRFPGLGSLRIISGYRTAEEQDDLRASGRPAAPDEASTHRSCPATGADLDLPFTADPYAKLELGRLSQLVGLRWGGGSRLDSKGIPVDWNHVDLGPRRS